MSQNPPELYYAKTHEWVRREEDGTVTVGITEHAQDALGDVVYVETPEVGDSIAAGDQAGVVESVKAASDIYAPLTGEVVATNEGLEDAPETVHKRTRPIKKRIADAPTGNNAERCVENQVVNLIYFDRGTRQLRSLPSEPPSEDQPTDVG